MNVTASQRFYKFIFYKCRSNVPDWIKITCRTFDIPISVAYYENNMLLKIFVPDCYKDFR